MEVMDVSDALQFREAIVDFRRVDSIRYACYFWKDAGAAVAIMKT